MLTTFNNMVKIEQFPTKKTSVYFCCAFLLFSACSTVVCNANDSASDDDATEAVIIHEAEGRVKVGLAKEKPTWDPRGYILFCPCMGRFGNQAEHYVGTLAFAKALDRTLVLAPFRTYQNVGFEDYFLVEPLKQYHRVISMGDFMEYLAPQHWPVGKRRGYCYMQVNSESVCDLKAGNPFGPFWDGFHIDFDETLKFELPIYAQDGNLPQNKQIKAAWDERFPVDEHPVLALRGAPAPFPMLEVNRQIQQYFHWAPGIFAEAKGYMDQMFKGEKYVAIHLRTGIDWERACRDVAGIRRYMASPQCHELDKEATNREMCYPSVKHVLEHTRNALQKIGAKQLFIATDKHSYEEEFKRDLKSLKVSVHRLSSDLPMIDLVIMGEADFFIGNCVSSFSSFVKRYRDARNKPSTFWNRALDDPMTSIGEYVAYKRT
ncbi:GDP-fucose protein O-fucosyltransferase 1-like [Amphiura filiformis]|uniref:GDP-fucose protein O-fucosyltransferase 1-like n=1 Tax=Amphiura filiformis TaxID=82378 RepID=UPI003B211857